MDDVTAQRPAHATPMGTRVAAVLAVVVVAAVLGGSSPASAHQVAPLFGEDSRSVERLYAAYFLREPDAAGLAYWNAQRTGGRSLGAISSNFATSAEFRSRYGQLDDAAFIRLVYRNVMGREADAGGLAHWSAALGSGYSRGAVMVGFSDSPEFKVATGAFDDPSTAPAPAGSFRFVREVGGEPVRWNPCSRIDVVFNPEHGPEGTTEVVRRALAEISRVSGVQWRLISLTDEEGRASVPRDAYLPEQHADRWAPVLIAFDASGDLGSSAALAGARYVGTPTGGEVYVSGRVLFNPDMPDLTLSRMYRTLLHELGHVAGLAHPEADDQFMSAGAWRVPDWQAGDYEGFRRLGPSAGCVAVPAPS